MLKHWAKQVLPGRWRPIFLRIVAVLNGAADFPAALRLRLFPRAKPTAANLASRERRIAFVSERPSWREAKLAFGLKKAGWDVILLHRHPPATIASEDVAEMQQFSSPSNAVELARRSGAELFHVFAQNCDDTCIKMVDYKPGHVIIDFYDDFASVIDGLPEMADKFAVDAAKQEYCIERADAFCCRDLQLQYHRKMRFVGRGRPVLYFPEYCWNRHALPPLRNDGETHVVQIGWMGFETRGERDLGCFLVARAFVEAGCHFHIYLHPSFPAPGTALFHSQFRDYLELQVRTGRVWIHETLPSQDIVGAIARYDFGFNMLNGSSFDNIPWTHTNPRRFPYCGSSRMFDYLDAGLGMFADSALALMHHTFGRYGVMLDGSALVRTNRIRDALSKKPGREQVLRARDHLSVARNIGRLTRFYDRFE